LEGLDDYIIVESNNVLLVCKKHNEQFIKQIVSDIKTTKGDKYI
jgi:mannose-1-phosphate guanylyltransferase